MHTIRRLNKAQRSDTLRAYLRTFGRGLLAHVAKKTHKDPSVVSRTWAGKIRNGDESVINALALEIHRLVYRASTTMQERGVDSKVQNYPKKVLGLDRRKSAA
jgi:hypothetical protein